MKFLLMAAIPITIVIAIIELVLNLYSCFIAINTFFNLLKEQKFSYSMTLI